MIFVYLGGFDYKNITDKILREIDKILSNYYICTDKNYIFKNNILRKINKNNFHYLLYSSSISITSGGLTMFNSIFYRTPNISIPQYSHQSQNIANINCTIKCNIGKNINNNLRNIIEYILFNKEFNIVKTKINFVSKVLKNQLGLKEIKKIYEN